MDFFLHILPIKDCLLKIGNSQSMLKKNKINTFLLSMPPTNLALSFLPTEQDFYEQTVLLNFKKPELCSNFKNIQLVVFAPNNFLLKFQDYPKSQTKSYNIKSKSISFASQSHTLYYSKNDNFFIRLESSEGQYLDLDYNAIITQLDHKQNGDTLLLYAKTNNEKYLTALIQYQNKHYKCINIEQIDLLEIDKNKITTYKSLNNTAHHGIIKEYNFDNKFTLTTSLVSDPDGTTKIQSQDLIPYAFLDAIKAKDFDLARTYLSPTLSQKLSDDHLSTFFDEFDFFMQSLLPNASKNDIALIYPQGNLFVTKIFSFYFQDNQISNIIEK